MATGYYHPAICTNYLAQLWLWRILKNPELSPNLTGIILPSGPTTWRLSTNGCHFLPHYPWKWKAALQRWYITPGKIVEVMGLPLSTLYGYRQYWPKVREYRWGHGPEILSPCSGRRGVSWDSNDSDGTRDRASYPGPQWHHPLVYPQYRALYTTRWPEAISFFGHERP